MNILLHIFGSCKNDLQIYPQGTTNITLPHVLSTKVQRLLSIERLGKIISYTFYQRLSSDDCIGFRISLNDMQISKPKALMGMLSDIVDSLIAKGEIVRIGNHGKIHFRMDNLPFAANEVEALRNYISSRFLAEPQTFGCSKLLGCPDFNETITINFNKSDEEIEAKTYISTCVFVKDQSGHKSYIQAIINDLERDLRAKHQSVLELTQEKATLIKQKKQFRVVIVLMILLLCAGCGIISINSNLNNTRANLFDANEQISRDSLTICNLKNENESLNKDIKNLRINIKNFEVLSQGLHRYYYLPDWHSSNHTNNSVSNKSYNFYAYEGDTLSFDYYVDSEHADYFLYNVMGPSTDSNGKYSGSSNTGTIEVPITNTGHFVLSLSYSKDVSINQYSDQASVYNIHIIRGDVKNIQDRLQ